MSPWLGPQSVAYIPVTPINDYRFGTPPGFKDLVTQRLLFDPDANGVDKSLRTYFFNVSYGRAVLEPTVFDPVTVPDAYPIGLGQATGHAIEESLGGFPAFTNACAVFAPNPGYFFDDHAFWGYPPITGTNVTNFLYDFLNSVVGAWAMEVTHILTSFGDLYGHPGDPGSFDNMSCACGVHPSTFTKLKLGWLDESEIVDVRAGPVTTQTLHALALPRPSPPGRYTAFRIPTSDPQHYFLVEARLRTDVFDAGIPSEGVVVYEVNEATWPPLQLLTPAALGASQSFEDLPNFRVTVDAAVTGGFTVEIGFGENPQCPVLRSQIATVQSRIQAVETELELDGDLSAKQKAVLLASLRALRAELTTLQGDLVRMGCAP